MLEQLLHLHLVHDIERVIPLIQVEYWLAHHLVQLGNVVLPLQVIHEAPLNVVIQQLTLGNQRIDLLLFYLPRNAIDQQRILYRVVLAQHGIKPVVFPI